MATRELNMRHHAGDDHDRLARLDTVANQDTAQHDVFVRIVDLKNTSTHGKRTVLTWPIEPNFRTYADAIQENGFQLTLD